MNCGSEDVSPQITRLPTASKLITNPMGVLNQAKEDYRHLKLDQLLANIENIPPAPNFQGFSYHQGPKLTSQNQVNYFKSSFRRKNNLQQNVTERKSPSFTLDCRPIFPHRPPLDLLPIEQIRYLESYESRLLRNFQDHDRVMAKDKTIARGYLLHDDISESLRARLIDWILHCTQVCEMEDRNIFFIVIRLVDFFYRMQLQPQPKSEYQLTAIAAIFMSSKLLQINHVNLQFCYNNIGHEKFSHTQIIERESHIMELAGWEISTDNTVYEVFELLFLMLKTRLHGRLYESESEIYLKEVWNLSLLMIRAQICSFEAIRRRHLNVASSAIQLSLAYLCLQVQQKRHSFLQLTTSHSQSILQHLGGSGHEGGGLHSPKEGSGGLHKSQSTVNTQLLQAEILLIINTWRELCIEYQISNVQEHMLELARDVLRIREMMAVEGSTQQVQEGTTGGQNEEGSRQPQMKSHQQATRIKEIMVFSDTHIEWLSKYLQEGIAEERKVNQRGSIMMFRTEEEDLSEESGELEDQVHGL